LLLLGVKALDSVHSLETVSATDYEQAPINYCNSELKTPSIHIRHLGPAVFPQVVLLYANGTWSQIDWQLKK
jgi:hypothetical protein